MVGARPQRREAGGSEAVFISLIQPVRPFCQTEEPESEPFLVEPEPSQTHPNFLFEKDK
jgi:hypothetical protein